MIDRLMMLRSRCTSVVAAILQSSKRAASALGVRRPCSPTCWRPLPALWAVQRLWGTSPSSSCRRGPWTRPPAVVSPTAVCRRPTSPRHDSDRRVPPTSCRHCRLVTPRMRVIP